MARRAFQLTADQKQFINEHRTAFTAEQMAVKLKVYVVSVWKYCRENGIEPRRTPALKKELKKSGKWVKELPIIRHRDTTDELQKQFERPPAVYGNIPSPYGIADELHNRSLNKQF